VQVTLTGTDSNTIENRVVACDPGRWRYTAMVRLAVG
jgi:hypothetical protein